MTEEPLVMPYTLGAALERLSHIRGAVARDAELAAALPAATPEHLHRAREALILALESGDQATKQKALGTAQSYLRQLLETLAQPGLFADSAQKFALLGFPDPLSDKLAPVDVSTVVTTFSRPDRQMFTTIAFEASPGARGYRLRETRHIEGEDFVDDTLESLTPVFRRARLPIGVHRLAIESRNASGFVMSEEFQVIVPQDV